MNGRERHEAGIKWDFHVLVIIVLCVNFTVMNHKCYIYVFGGVGYEDVGDEIQLNIQLVI